MLTKLKTHINLIKKTFDRRDLFVFGGLAMLFYGFYLYSPAVAFSVCGGILLAIGLVGYAFGGRE